MDEEEQINYYFNQFWAFENPAVLRMGDLTEALFKRYKEEWLRVPKTVGERRLQIINNNFKINL